MTASSNSDDVTASGDIDSPFQRAALLYEAGRFEEASAILARLLDADPSSLDARHALAMCQVKLNRVGEAISNFRWIVEHDPARFDDGRRLGILLQEEGAYRQAAEAFRGVLAVNNYMDTADRLRHCERVSETPSSYASSSELVRPGDAGLISPIPEDTTSSTLIVDDIIKLGPVPIRKVIDEFNATDRGKHIQDVRQQLRYVLPSVGRVAAEAIAVTLLLILVPVVVYLLPVKLQSQLSELPLGVVDAWKWIALLVILFIWIRAAIKIGALFLQSRLYRISVYQRGMDIATGVFRRRKQYLWYYQISEEPAYVRRPSMFLTNTASLQVKYNNGNSATKSITLAGIGSPREVDNLRADIESRRLAERATMKGFLT